MTTVIKIKDIDHQRGVASSQVLLHQSKSEPAKPMHYRLRGSMGTMPLYYNGYKKWAQVDTCFSFNKPTKQDILYFLRCL